MPEITYEIPKELLLELMAVCDLATEAWDQRMEEATLNKQAVEYSRLSYQAAEAWHRLRAVRDGEAYQPVAFEEVRCVKCGDTTDTGDPHDCGEEEA
jgi:hypothetical protein